jgi:hypothetical protein
MSPGLVMAGTGGRAGPAGMLAGMDDNGVITVRDLRRRHG